MATEHSKRLQQALAPSLKARGFQKSGTTWRRASPDAVAVVNIQGSQWSPMFYLNLGVYFRALGDRDKPCSHHCHVRTRLSDLVPDAGRLGELLDLVRLMPDDARFQAIEKLVLDFALPWLDKLSSVHEARAFCVAPDFRSYWLIGIEPQQFLGLIQAPDRLR